MTLSRRTFLGGVLAVAACAGDDGGDGGDADSAAPTTGAERTEPSNPSTTTAPDLPGGPFTLGVASGDPDSTSVVLWTRLALDPLAPAGGNSRPVRSVEVDVATDDTFDTLVVTRSYPVDVDRASSVHAVVDGLDPGTEYAYRFRIGDHTSPVGRTRTTPAPGDDATVRLALASCQRYGDGRYVAHRDMAEADLDLVVWVGDYIYEVHGGGRRPAPSGAPDEATDLDGYRHRYAAARLDPDLAANHAAHPWAVTWDDHEVQSDYQGGSGSVDPDRQAAAYQAWWEHMPVRLPPPAGPALAIHRSIRLGDTTEVFLLDTRQHRSAESCGGGVVDDDCDELVAPGRTMLGADQEAWLDGALAASPARWSTVAQSVVVSRVDVLGSVNADAWDGYGAARSRLLGALAGTRNAVVLTGDVHVQVVADITDDDGTVVATELVTASVTSQPAAAYREGVGLLPTLVEDVQHAADVRGWLRCELDADAFRATYREVADVSDPSSPVLDGPTFVVRDGVPGARLA